MKVWKICESSQEMNKLLMLNWIHGMEKKCSGHTYAAAVDFTIDFMWSKKFIKIMTDIWAWKIGSDAPKHGFR